MNVARMFAYIKDREGGAYRVKVFLSTDVAIVGTLGEVSETTVVIHSDKEDRPPVFINAAHIVTIQEDK